MNLITNILVFFAVCSLVALSFFPDKVEAGVKLIVSSLDIRSPGIEMIDDIFYEPKFRSLVVGEEPDDVKYPERIKSEFKIDKDGPYILVTKYKKSRHHKVFSGLGFTYPPVELYRTCKCGDIKNHLKLVDDKTYEMDAEPFEFIKSQHRINLLVKDAKLIKENTEEEEKDKIARPEDIQLGSSALNGLVIFDTTIYPLMEEIK